MGTEIIAYRPAIGKIYTDPHTYIKYRLEKVIGTSGFDFVYKASYYTPDYSDNGNLLPSGYVTVKYLRAGEDIVRSLSQEQTPVRNYVNVDAWFIRRFNDGFCTALKYMSEGSIRYMLSTRFHYGLPEDCIAIVLKEALVGLHDIHNSGQVHRTFSAENIFVNFVNSNVEIKLAFAATAYESDLDCPTEMNVEIDHGPHVVSTSVPPLSIISEWAAAPEVYNALYDNAAKDQEEDQNCRTFKSDMWLVGIAALELAYGNIRANSRAEFDAMINKIRLSKRLPNKLEYLLEEIMAEEAQKFGKMKGVVESFFKDKLKLGKKKRAFSKEFENVVLECLNKKAAKRPTIEKLLQMPFFQNAKDLKWFKRCVLHAKGPMPIADYGY
ncbi:serine/threonine-protein kinase BLUS1-like [Lycium ferocissimum]|uniref:serine/threonine-protein kinase BLUS1-like n=1 Tax=Lycium ferocissimum TaxID=112874 RepID=UPI002815E4DA|nr:serine/threonine-protein kinase BLUS1-like [Lycium ferocissimum]